MIITRESLLRVARETVAQRIHSHPETVAVYLTGSLLTEEPLLGGCTDIDLVFVQPFVPSVRREIVPLTNEIHLDIKYNPRSEYAQPRQLRQNPWLGPELYAPLRLHDGQHFFDFVQAGVRDKFDDPINLLARSHLNLEHARGLWSDLQGGREATPQTALLYLKAINHAANAIAILHGNPLAERRFLPQFIDRAGACGYPQLSANLIHLLGGDQIEMNMLESSLAPWQETFLSASGLEKRDVRLHPARLNYYLQGLQVYLKGDHPHFILWPLLHTWSLAADVLPLDSRSTWRDFMQSLGLLRDGFESYLEKLDHFMDEVENILDRMAASHGIHSGEKE